VALNGNILAWFEAGVVRVTVPADELETGRFLRMEKEWRKLAQDGTLLGGIWAISPGPETIR
jgi:hypothetical protein